jgi:hypothetical protein
MRALGEDPWNGAARYDLQVALHQAAGCLAPGAAQPLALRTHVTLAAAGVLVREPDLLAAYAARTTSGADATLLVTYADAPELDELAAMVERLGLDGDDSPDIVAQPAPATEPARRLLATQAAATLGAPSLAVAA